MIIAKEVGKIRKTNFFGAVNERRPGGSARGYRSGSDPKKVFKGSSQKRRKRSEVVKELSEQHEIEFKEQI